MSWIRDETINLLADIAMIRSPGLTRERALARARLVWCLVRWAHQGQAGASLRDLQREIRSVPPAELRQLVHEAVAEGTVQAVRVPSGPRGGRPRVLYRWAVGQNRTSPR